MKWEYVKSTVDLSMHGYVKAVLHRLQHPIPVCPQYSPHKHQTIKYGAKVQFVEPKDVTKPLTVEQKVTLQHVVGCLLYYARAVDHTIQHSCVRPDEGHRGNGGGHVPVIELLRHTSGCRNMIPCIRYYSAHQQQCILPL
jgi:hypothetical protein